MLHAYVDESERDDRFYFLGAVICTDTQQAMLSAELEAVLEKHRQVHPSLTPEVEFHGSAMMRAEEEPWRSIPLRARLALYRDALIATEAVGVRIYIEGVNVPGQIARGYPEPTPARELAFSHLMERINDCCSDDEPRIKIYADEHHTSEISRSNFRSYRAYGTYGYRSSRLPNIEPEIEFVPSHTLRPLQASDLVTYLYNRIMTIKDGPKSHAAKWHLWGQIVRAVNYPRGRERIWP